MNNKDKSSDSIAVSPIKCDYSPKTYSSLIKQHKNLPREYFRATMIKYDPCEVRVNKKNEVSSSDVNEGLIKTYPTKKTLSFVCDRLNKKRVPIRPTDFSLLSPNDDGTIYGNVIISIYLDDLSSEIDSLLINSFKACGYYLSATSNRIDDDGMSCVVYQFEPTFQTNISNPTIGRYLYHITTENAARKILKYGMSPSNRTKNGFKYTNRNYFFTIYNEGLFEEYMDEAKKINIKGKNKFDYNFKVLTIDTDKTPNLELYTDPNFDNKIAVFTYNNIPPTAIVRCDGL